MLLGLNDDCFRPSCQKIRALYTYKVGKPLSQPTGRTARHQNSRKQRAETPTQCTETLIRSPSNLFTYTYFRFFGNQDAANEREPAFARTRDSDNAAAIIESSKKAA